MKIFKCVKIKKKLNQNWKWEKKHYKLVETPKKLKIEKNHKKNLSKLKTELIPQPPIKTAVNSM